MFPRERFFRSRKTNPPRSRAARIENTDTQKEIRARRSRALCSRVLRVAGASAGGAAQHQETPCASMGKARPKRKRASEKRHNHPARGGGLRRIVSPLRGSAAAGTRAARRRKKKSSEKVLAEALFFFVRIGAKEMRHAPAGTRRRFRFRETLIVLFPTIQIAS